MAETVTTAAQANVLKLIWPQKRLDYIFYKDHPLAAMVSKKDDFYGRQASLQIVVQHGVPSGGRSALFADAQANRSGGNEVNFAITRRSDYQTLVLENEAMEASEKDVGSLVSLLKNKGDGALANLARNFAAMLWGNGGGSRGVVSAVTAGDATTDRVDLETADDISKFEVDMSLYADTRDGTLATVSRGTTLFVRKIDRDNGYLYISDSLGGAAYDISGAATPWSTTIKYLFQEGDYGQVIQGVPAWVPLTTPTAGESFNGVDRSIDPTRLAGSRHVGTSDPIEEAIKTLAAKMRRNGAQSMDLVGFAHPLDFNNLELSLSTRVQYSDLKSSHAQVGFDAITFATGMGKIKIVADVDCPRGEVYVLDVKNFTFHSLKAVPRVQQLAGGSRLLTLDNADSVETRMVYRGNLATDKPFNHGVCSIATS